MKDIVGSAITQSFRPLDGESFSKRHLECCEGCQTDCFRPLDGESFSKPYLCALKDTIPGLRFPSPRRGIIF